MTAPVKPLTGEAAWLAELHAVRPEVSIPGYWDALEENAVEWARQIGVGHFWDSVEKKSEEWSARFHREKGGVLFAHPGTPSFFAKSKQSIRRKAFRDRKRSDEKDKVLGVWPVTGPPVPMHYDLVRTRVECLFMDGVEFLVDRLCELAAASSLKFRRVRRGLSEGYFAQHFYFEQQVYFRFGGGSSPASIMCEVQAGTVLSTRIWSEAHKVYEATREREPSEDDDAWQWDPTNPRFIARQLGHMLHLADGILMQLRDARKGGK